MDPGDHPGKFAWTVSLLCSNLSNPHADQDDDGSDRTNQTRMKVSGKEDFTGADPLLLWLSLTNVACLCSGCVQRLTR